MEDGKKVSPAPKAKKRKKKIGRICPVIYYPALAVISLIYRLKYNVHVHRGALEGLRGPIIVLAPHLSNKDHVFTAMALRSHRATYVLSEHFHTTTLMRVVCHLIHGINKKMFCPDTRAVLNILRAVKEGNSVVLFPEGRLTWYGRSLEVTEGTAELCKQLKIPVVCITSDGAGKTFPKWAKCPRRGRVDVNCEVLFTPEQLAAMSVEEIDAGIRRVIKHDEEKVQQGIRFRTKDTTLGLDGIIWKCPSCGAEFSLVTGGGKVSCKDCGFAAELDEFGAFSDNENLRANGIKTVADFYEFCAASLDISKPLSMSVTVSGTDSEGYMQRGIGEGVVTVGKDGYSFSGKVDGEPLEFTLPPEKVAGLPITIGDHVDIYNKGRLLLMEPSPDRRRVIVLVAYTERLRRSLGLAKD